MQESNEVEKQIDNIVRALESSLDGDALTMLEEMKVEMMTPRRREFVLSDTYERIGNGDKTRADFWVILEDPDSGYCIVFDDASEEFGLGLCGSDGENRFLGVKGSLLYVYGAM